MGLAAWFNKVRAEFERARELTTCMNAALEATAVSDPDGLRKALARIDPSDVSAVKREELLKVAIASGDAKTFAALLAFTGDPHATITETMGGGRSVPIDYYIPLLNYALRVRSHDIALALAKDPRTNIEQHAYLDSGTPLTMAREAGMSDVAAVLAQRTAELRRQEAVWLDEMAAKLSSAPQVK
jgi:hypothetical protein